MAVPALSPTGCSRFQPSFAGLSSRSAMNFEWRRWLTCRSSPRTSICVDKVRLQPAAFGHLVGRQTLTPPALLAAGAGSKRGRSWISSLWKRSKNLVARNAGTETSPDARNVDEVVALVVADDDRVEVLWRRDVVAADHKLLDLVDAHLFPSAGAPARLVATIAALGDHAFKALLSGPQRDDFGGRGLQGFRKGDLSPASGGMTLARSNSRRSSSGRSRRFFPGQMQKVKRRRRTGAA